MYMYISILCARTIPGLSRSMVCARAIRGLRGQSMVYGTNNGSRVCAGESLDCANPCFAHNIYHCMEHSAYQPFHQKMRNAYLRWKTGCVLLHLHLFRHANVILTAGKLLLYILLYFLANIQHTAQHSIQLQKPFLGTVCTNPFLL